MRIFYSICFSVLVAFGVDSGHGGEHAHHNEHEHGFGFVALPECDFATEDCVVKFEDKEIKFSLSPRPIVAMMPLTLRISGLDEQDGLKVKISGVNMDMGANEYELVRRGGDYMANITVSSCVMQQMIYRAQIFSNDKPLGLYSDFVLRNN